MFNMLCYPTWPAACPILGASIQALPWCLEFLPGASHHDFHDFPFLPVSRGNFASCFAWGPVPCCGCSESLMVSVIFFAVICWGSNMKGADTNRLVKCLQFSSYSLSWDFHPIWKSPLWSVSVAWWVFPYHILQVPLQQSLPWSINWSLKTVCLVFSLSLIDDDLTEDEYPSQWPKRKASLFQKNGVL